MKTCGWVIVASCILQACGVRAEADTGAVLDTIAQINHINWIVNTIRTYNNVVVLEEEYDKISPGRLNLNRIPDEETLGRITKMLDTLHRLRMEERELHRWQESFNAMRQKQLRDFWIKQAGSVDVGGIVRNVASPASRRSRRFGHGIVDTGERGMLKLRKFQKGWADA